MEIEKKAEKEIFTILHLPKEILYDICYYFSFRKTFSLCFVCKKWMNHILEMPENTMKKMYQLPKMIKNWKDLKSRILTVNAFEKETTFPLLQTVSSISDELVRCYSIPDGLYFFTFVWSSTRDVFTIWKDDKIYGPLKQKTIAKKTQRISILDDEFIIHTLFCNNETTITIYFPTCDELLSIELIFPGEIHFFPNFQKQKSKNGHKIAMFICAVTRKSFILCLHNSQFKKIEKKSLENNSLENILLEQSSIKIDYFYEFFPHTACAIIHSDTLLLSVQNSIWIFKYDQKTQELNFVEKTDIQLPTNDFNSIYCMEFEDQIYLFFHCLETHKTFLFNFFKKTITLEFAFIFNATDSFIHDACLIGLKDIVKLTIGNSCFSWTRESWIKNTEPEKSTLPPRISKETYETKMKNPRDSHIYFDFLTFSLDEHNTIYFLSQSGKSFSKSNVASLSVTPYRIVFSDGDNIRYFSV